MKVIYTNYEACQLIAEKHNTYVDNVDIDITDKYDVPPSPAPSVKSSLDFLDQDALRLFWSEAIAFYSDPKRVPNRIALIKAVRTLRPGTSLKEAKDFVDSLFLPF